eukprot:TRINITY_DN22873_c0_g1_i1.p1 TRINITY_DN22873_c0_g1~~TRINITY_DN22873_c0_g1_i1.p1  ORF type:complete len:101 (-),score=3.19 TRINITY_DN22873_c0_g1_i1:216-518(-)
MLIVCRRNLSQLQMLVFVMEGKTCQLISHIIFMTVTKRFSVPEMIRFTHFFPRHFDCYLCVDASTQTEIQNGGQERHLTHSSWSSEPSCPKSLKMTYHGG